MNIDIFQLKNYFRIYISPNVDSIGSFCLKKLPLEKNMTEIYAGQP